MDAFIIATDTGISTTVHAYSAMEAISAFRAQYGWYAAEHIIGLHIERERL